MLPFGGFFLKLIGGQIISAVFQKVTQGQVPTTVADPTGVTIETKHWAFSKTIWGALAIIAYAGANIAFGQSIDINVINDIINDGGNLFLIAASLLVAYGRAKV